MDEYVNEKNKRRCKLYGICSERQSEADLAMEEWNMMKYTAFIGDSDNRICKYIQEQYMSKLVITDCPLPENAKGALHTDNFPSGAVQPAVLFFIRDKPVIAWANQPSIMNLKGSLGRPNAKQVWMYIDKCIQSDEFTCSDGTEMKQSAMYWELIKTSVCTIL